MGRLLHSLARRDSSHEQSWARDNTAATMFPAKQWLIIAYIVYIRCGYTSFRLWVHNNFHMFSYSECFAVFSRCRVDMKLETCRVPSSGYEQLRGRGSSNQRRIYRHFLRFEA